MHSEGAPFAERELKITGKDLLDGGMPAQYVGKVLHGLLLHCAADPQDNRADRLKGIAFGIYNDLLAAQARKG